MAKPTVVFLDEPTTGLDPRSRLTLWETIEGLVSEGTTVLLTTQYLDEADRLADSITVIDHGQVIASGTSDELKDRVGGERVEVVLEDPADAERAVAALGQMAAEAPSAADGVVSAPVRTRRGVIAEAVGLLSDAGNRHGRHQPAPADAGRRVPVAHRPCRRGARREARRRSPGETSGHRHR